MLRILVFLALLAGIPAFAATQKLCVSCATYTSYTSICSSNLVSQPSATTAPCDTVIANSTNLDLYENLFFVFGTLTSAAQVSAAPVNFFHYYLNQDGSYGAGDFTGTAASAGAGAPNPIYQINCTVYAIPGATTAFKGSCTNIPLAALNYKIMVNNATNPSGTGAFASSGNTGYILTSNYTIAQNEIDRLVGALDHREFLAMAAHK